MRLRALADPLRRILAKERMPRHGISDGIGGTVRERTSGRCQHALGNFGVDGCEIWRGFIQRVEGLERQAPGLESLYARMAGRAHEQRALACCGLLRSV